MAERRMFTKKITDSDAFLDMPSSTQCLYFQLNMNADDDGFVNSPKKIQRTIGASDSDMKILENKNFIILFKSGIVVIKHWLMHNTIRKDRYHETDYLEEKQLLFLKENKAYTLIGNQLETIGLPTGNQESNEYDTLEKDDKQRVLDTWQPNDNQLATEVRLGKISLDKVSIEENNKRHLLIDKIDVENPVEILENEMLENDLSYSLENCNPIDYFETEFGRPISQMEVMRIGQMISENGQLLVMYALREALTYEKKNVDYIDRILYNWKVQGFTTNNYEEGKR